MGVVMRAALEEGSESPVGGKMSLDEQNGTSNKKNGPCLGKDRGKRPGGLGSDPSGIQCVSWRKLLSKGNLYGILLNRLKWGERVVLNVGGIGGEQLGRIDLGAKKLPMTCLANLG